MDLLEVTKDELKKITDLQMMLQVKWKHKEANLKNLEELQKEVVGRFMDIGYIVNVDITPALVGIGFPDIAIVGRIEGMTDHEKIRKEVRELYEYEGKLKHGKLKKDLKRD